MAKHSVEVVDRMIPGRYVTRTRDGASGASRLYRLMRSEVSAAYAVFGERIENATEMRGHG